MVVVGFHGLVIRFEFIKEIPEFFPGSHGRNFDFGGSPTGEFTDILDALFLEVEEADDDLLAGFERGDEAVEEGAH